MGALAGSRQVCQGALLLPMRLDTRVVVRCRRSRAAAFANGALGSMSPSTPDVERDRRARPARCPIGGLACRYGYHHGESTHDQDRARQARRRDRGLAGEQAKSAVDAVFDTIAGELAAGRDIAIAGFGKFTVAERAAREGRNPATGESIQIAASRAAKFSAAAALKSQLNG